jgi:alkylresorcinol/alkylpyrone synthase
MIFHDFTFCSIICSKFRQIFLRKACLYVLTNLGDDKSKKGEKMPYILSVGMSIPEYPISQEEAKQLLFDIFPDSKTGLERYLSVFDHALISERQLIVPKKWFRQPHSFADRNRIYIKKAIVHSIESIENCLQNTAFLEYPVTASEIDAIFFISSTGISTPTIDAHLYNQLNFPDDIMRFPLWGLGCAGGAGGLGRASEWLKANPSKNAIVVNVEFCSIAFQNNGDRKSNIIGAALFGDGVSCTLLSGDKSPLRRRAKGSSIAIKKYSSRIKKESLDIMGWDIKESGLQVIFAKSIPNLVKTFWYKHVQEFLPSLHAVEDFPFIIAHPGGRKVLEAMEEVLSINKEKLRYSYKVLREHGNMSSSTVIYVLNEAMQQNQPIGTKSLLTALGPGFSSEIVQLEWE